MKGAGYGAFRDIIVGIVGAFIGEIVMRLFGIHGQAGSDRRPCWDNVRGENFLYRLV